MKINYTLFLLAFSMNCYHHSLQAMNNASKNSNIIIIPEVKIELTRDEKVKIVKDVQKYFTPFNIVLNPYEIIDHGVLKLSTKLKKLKLKEKQDLLTHISKFTWLTSLFLRDNNLSSLPNSIRNLNNLTKLYLKKNNFTVVPNAIGRLTNLICIDFSYNQLELLPSSIGNLIHLEKADFSFNRIRSLPDTIKNLTQLTKLDLTNNKLIFVPSSIGKIGALITLCLTDNPQLLSNGDDPLKCGKNELKDHFVDRVTLDPPSLKAPSVTSKKVISVTPIKNTRNTNAVNVRSVSQNTKPIVDKPKPANKPVELSIYQKKAIVENAQKKFSFYNIILEKDTIIQKKTLDLSKKLCNISPKIQKKLLSFVAKFIWLIKLDLSENEINSLSNAIQSLQCLTWLNLGANNLKILPDSIGNLINLNYLYLYSNKLNSLPNLIKNLAKLTILDLRNNEFTSLPDSIGSLIELKKLRLFNNKLFSLSTTIGNLNKLILLDLSKNKLTCLPITIKKFTKTRS